MAEEKDLISFIRDANDIAKLITGKTIPDLAKRSMELFGKGTARKIVEEEFVAPDSPYAVLGVRPDASTMVVRAIYKALIKGKYRSSDEYKILNEAYLKILHERGER